MSDLKLNMKDLSGGVRYDIAPELLGANQLADALNFLPSAAGGGAQKVKFWLKDLLNTVGTADDRIYTGNPVIAAASAALETDDPNLPRFDPIEEVFYFYSNCFDDGATNYGAPDSSPNVPISLSGNNWTTNYTFYNPTLTASIKAGFYLYKDVVLTTDKPLYVSVPVRQNGAYSALTHEATCDVYYIDGTQPSWAQQATATVNVGAGGFARLEFAIEVAARNIAYAGEYYVVITQATTTPTVDGYSFLGPITYSTGTNAKLFGWAELPSAQVTGEAVLDAAISASVTSGVGGVATVVSTHSFVNTPVIAATVAYKGSIACTAFTGGSVIWDIQYVFNLNAQTYTETAHTWNIADTYVQGDVVRDGGNLYQYKNVVSTSGHLTSEGAYWNALTMTVTWGTTGLPIVTTGNNVISLTMPSVSFTGPDMDVTVNYNYPIRSGLAEMIVYQKPSEAASFTASATTLYKGTRYTRKNAAMPAGAEVRTDKELPVWLLSDKHSFFALYQTTDLDEAVADARIVSGTMLNTLDQYVRWYSAAGAQNADRRFYYLPKFIGEVTCFLNHQNRMVFGGVGGIAIFDPRNILEASSYAGKVRTPWRDIIVPDINQRADSQYLSNAAVATIDVHPPVIKAMFVYGDQPGRIVALAKDYIIFQGGDAVATANNVWEWQALAINQLGDGQDEMKGGIFFDGRGILWTKRGDIYTLAGVPPVDWTNDVNTLTVQKERSLGEPGKPIVIEHAVDTGMGFLVIVDQHGNFYSLDASLYPTPLEGISAYQGDRVNIGVTGLRWEAARRRLWIHTDGYLGRSYYASSTFTEVNVSARSFVYDADKKSFWPVQSPLDAETRTNEPTVFRDGNVSWSAGYYYNDDDLEFTFVLECQVAGADPLPIHNSDEALYQPENSSKHATSTTSWLLTPLLQAEDHAVQVSYLQSLARFINGANCTLYVVVEGVETSLGTFSETTDFVTLAAKVNSLRLNIVPLCNSFQIKLSIANAYADTVRNLLIHADLAGPPV